MITQLEQIFPSVVSIFVLRLSWVIREKSQMKISYIPQLVHTQGALFLLGFLYQYFQIRSQGIIGDTKIKIPSNDNIHVCKTCHFPLIFCIFRFGEDESKRTDSSGMNKDDKSNLTLLMATFKHMTKPYQLLIIPLTIWSGLEQGFFLSDFTAGFISCLFGVDQIGWTLITYGVCDALFSLGFGVIMKYTGRPLIYVLGASINLSVIFTLMFLSLIHI